LDASSQLRRNLITHKWDFVRVFAIADRQAGTTGEMARATPRSRGHAPSGLVPQALTEHKEDSMTISGTSTLRIEAPNVGEYWVGQGGIYAGIMPDYVGHSPQHLIFSVDEATNLEWGGYGAAEPGALSLHDGEGNTGALMKCTHSHPAARWASEYKKDGHRDFHLPSRQEWEVAGATIRSTFAQDAWYWSSSEYTRTSAYGINFSGMDFVHLYKAYPGKARAVRTIPA
jgi:hypothetical protein